MSDDKEEAIKADEAVQAEAAAAENKKADPNKQDEKGSTAADFIQLAVENAGRASDDLTGFINQKLQASQKGEENAAKENVKTEIQTAAKTAAGVEAGPVAADGGVSTSSLRESNDGSAPSPSPEGGGGRTLDRLLQGGKFGNLIQMAGESATAGAATSGAAPNQTGSADEAGVNFATASAKMGGDAMKQGGELVNAGPPQGNGNLAITSGAQSPTPDMGGGMRPDPTSGMSGSMRPSMNGPV